jgi:G patch domain-containing protein 1
VLDQFIKPAQETIGVGLLKKMGWKPGQGIGPKFQKPARNKIITVC